jgi:hypothetical protein
MPSSSARCSQLPRAVDKVPFYESLKKLRDFKIGRISHLDDKEVCFPDLELKVVKKEKPDPDSKANVKKEAAAMGMVPNGWPSDCGPGQPMYGPGQGAHMMPGYNMGPCATSSPYGSMLGNTQMVNSAGNQNTNNMYPNQANSARVKQENTYNAQDFGSTHGGSTHGGSRVKPEPGYNPQTYGGGGMMPGYGGTQSNLPSQTLTQLAPAHTMTQLTPAHTMTQLTPAHTQTPSHTLTQLTPANTMTQLTPVYPNQPGYAEVQAQIQFGNGYNQVTGFRSSPPRGQQGDSTTGSPGQSAIGSPHGQGMGSPHGLTAIGSPPGLTAMGTPPGHTLTVLGSSPGLSLGSPQGQIVAGMGSPPGIGSPQGHQQQQQAMPQFQQSFQQQNLSMSSASNFQFYGAQTGMNVAVQAQGQGQGYPGGPHMSMSMQQQIQSHAFPPGAMASTAGPMGVKPEPVTFGYADPQQSSYPSNTCSRQ